MNRARMNSNRNSFTDVASAVSADKRSHHATAVAVAMMFVAQSQAAEFEGAKRVAYFGYENCVRLENEDVTVTLGHHAGGRVLEYAFKGTNAIWLDPDQAGWVHAPGGKRVSICGGRFDIGPEKIIPRRDKLWLGAWRAEITGPRSARLTSQEDTGPGVQLIRDFELDATSSRLICRQTIVNVSNEAKEWCHWSRTFAEGHGICVIPVSEPSRFPNKYVMYESGNLINIRPEDPNIRLRDGFLEVLNTPRLPKLGMDSNTGWFAYLMKNDLMFVKRFSVHPDRAYNEVAGLTISIWYYKDEKCELEPIGPRERIEPGASASFTEEWHLTPFAFPADRSAVDLPAVKRATEAQLR